MGHQGSVVDGQDSIIQVEDWQNVEEPLHDVGYVLRALVNDLQDGDNQRSDSTSHNVEQSDEEGT